MMPPTALSPLPRWPRRNRPKEWRSLTAIAQIFWALFNITTAQAQSHIHTPQPPNKEATPSLFTLSGELRERATFLSAIEYNSDVDASDWFWTQRARVNADIALQPRLRGRISLQSALQEGGEDSPVERNVLDVQELHVDIGQRRAFVRIGRQELRLGSQRLVGVREGTNVRRTWDGVRGAFDAAGWRFNALALREVAVKQTGAFNDDRNEGRDLAGLYATGSAWASAIDIYYLWAQFTGRNTIEGLGDESRHSVGARFFGEKRGVFWDCETVYQFGSLGDLDISAWTFAANTGFRWAERPWSPEIMLSANIASGDRDRFDGTYGTFNALYPRGSYFSENTLLGPSNFFNLHPYLRVRPHTSVLAFVDVNFFWRLKTTDGVYGPPGNLIRLPQGSQARFVDVSISAGTEWEASEQVFMSVLFTHSRPQRFIQETGPADVVNFLEFTLRFQF